MHKNMHKKSFHYFFIILIFLSIDQSLYAQTYKYELGLNLGAYVYQGDLAPSRYGSFKTIKPGIGISFARPLSNILSVRGIFNWASLSGNEAKYSEPEYRQHRAFAFKSSLRELGVHLQYNMLGKKDYWPKFEPYMFAGISAAFINTKKDFSGYDAAYFSETEGDQILAGLAVDNTERERRAVFKMPVGVGLRYNINSNWSVSTESNFRFGGSDYIDGYSESVNPAKKDHFLSQNLGVNYRLGKKGAKVGCPTAN